MVRSMKHLPNILSSLRMVGAVALLLCDVEGTTFWVLYTICGISDIADGWLARKLIPILRLPQWLWLWAGVIVAIKVVNQLSALATYGRCCFPHTLANKWAGFLLFIAIPMTFWSIIPISITAIVATFAAVQECCVLTRAESSHKI